MGFGKARIRSLCKCDFLPGIKYLTFSIIQGLDSMDYLCPVGGGRAGPHGSQDSFHGSRANGLELSRACPVGGGRWRSDFGRRWRGGTVYGARDGGGGEFTRAGWWGHGWNGWATGDGDQSADDGAGAKGAGGAGGWIGRRTRYK